MIGAGVDGDGKRHSCLDCNDGRDQACVMGLEERNDALVLLPVNHPLALSHPQQNKGGDLTFAT